MFNNTIKFKATESNRTINVGWSRPHIAGYEETLTHDGERYCLIVFTSIIDKMTSISAHKRYLLFGDEIDKFLDWFHSSY